MLLSSILPVVASTADHSRAPVRHSRWSAADVRQSKRQSPPCAVAALLPLPTAGPLSPPQPASRAKQRSAARSLFPLPTPPPSLLLASLRLCFHSCLFFSVHRALSARCCSLVPRLREAMCTVTVRIRPVLCPSEPGVDLRRRSPFRRVRTIPHYNHLAVFDYEQLAQRVNYCTEDCPQGSVTYSPVGGHAFAR